MTDAPVMVVVVFCVCAGLTAVLLALLAIPLIHANRLYRLVKRKYPQRAEWIKGYRVYKEDVQLGRPNPRRLHEYAVSDLDDGDPDVRLLRGQYAKWSFWARGSLGLLACTWIGFGAWIGFLELNGYLRGAGALFVYPIAGGVAFLFFWSQLGGRFRSRDG